MPKPLLVSLALLFIFCFFVSPVSAQDSGIEPGETFTQPKERQVQVQASVRDIVSPTTPILIAPANTSVVTTATPTFVWKTSTDAFGISHYELVLDGNTLFGSIPTADTTNDSYILTYSGATEYYSLTPISGLSQGLHTWKIVVYDIHGNSASSVTWTFTIDSQAPVFIVTQVDETQTSISAQDVQTVPTDPINLTNNEPIIQGTGEPNSSVELTVRLPDGQNDSYSFTIGDDGSWQVQLGLLPRDVVIYLDFLITDQAGHISVLTNVPIVLPTPKVTVTVSFIPEEVIQPVEIPIVPIIEVIPPFIETIVTQLPPPIQQLVAAFPFYYPTARETEQSLVLQILVILIMLALPSIKTLILTPLFGWNFSLSSLIQIWKAIGLLPTHNPQGIVIDTQTQQPIPYTLLEVHGKLPDNTVVRKRLLSTNSGVYPYVGLPRGTYSLTARHPQHIFPAQENRPIHLDWLTWYASEEFCIPWDAYDPSLCIPATQNPKTIQQPLYQFRSWLLTRSMTSIATGLLCVGITILFPTVWNIAATLLFTAIGYSVRSTNKKEAITVTAVREDKLPVANCICVLLSLETPQILDIMQTDENGLATFRRSTENKLLLRCFHLQYAGIPENAEAPYHVVPVTVQESDSKTQHVVCLFQ